jgi:hypothetical protein
VSIEELRTIGAATAVAETQAVLGGGLLTGVDVHLTTVQWHRLLLLRDDPTAGEAAVDALGRALGFRLTVTGPGGTGERVLGDDRGPVFSLSRRDGRCLVTPASVRAPQ